MTYFYAPISTIVSGVLLAHISSISLLLGFSAMLSVILVSRLTSRSLHDNITTVSNAIC